MVSNAGDGGSEGYDHVSVERGAVGRLVMDRPDANNSLNRAMAEELADATTALASDDEVRCIVVTGGGGTYNTGADLSTLEGDSSDAVRLRNLASRLHSAVGQLARAPKPVVCGVNGVVAGGGLGLALVGDLVLVSESARFEFAYPRIGLSGDGGSTYFLPRLVGLREAQRIAFRDEPVGADEAVEIGLATESVPDDRFDERLAEWAADLAEGPTRGHAATKALLRRSFGRGVDEQMAAEAETIAGLAETEDFARGHAAFFGEDDPEFTGR